MKMQLGLALALLGLASSVTAAEIYSLDLSAAAPGSEIVKTDETGKQIIVRKNWGMWPRDPSVVGAKVVDLDGVKAIEIAKGIQVNTNEWSMDSVDAQQSVVYAQFQVLVKEVPPGAVAGIISLQQKNNRTAAFIGLIANKEGKLAVSASNGDGKGKVSWRNVADVELGKWITIDVKMNFDTKTYDVTVNGKTAENNAFRHAADWEGTMWAVNKTSRDYRYDIKADMTTVYCSQVKFSADPIGK